jgi:hypothetical protein
MELKAERAGFAETSGGGTISTAREAFDHLEIPEAQLPQMVARRWCHSARPLGLPDLAVEK